jgi:putative SOS response-associated peptidase YedK
VLAVRFNQETKERSLDALRWGLVPHRAKDLKMRSRMINARAEAVAILPAFRDAFNSRRCIIPASGFYEWVQTGAAKQPYAIVPEGDPLFAFAGLWESWRDRPAGDGAEWIRTCTIITGEPNEFVAPIHNRMPVILPREAWPLWLSEQPASADELQALLKPLPARAHARPPGQHQGQQREERRAVVDRARSVVGGRERIPDLSAVSQT